ncbi:MAG: AbrB/MazE/SpoVT family DNA-binding domain-containing protein, partial [Opitutales bacterium]|nr:AbrB/MazE/SpoVT family DNA-binding domain-containing protein [Opitutales bacterium]
MPTLQSKVTSKGQITLPKQIRSKLAIRTGDRLEFSLETSNRISVRKMGAPGSSAGCGKPFLPSGHKPSSVEEMDDGIRKAVSAKYGRLKTPR